MRPVEYAIDELWSLLGQAGSEKGPEDATVRYLCALFAELAYHHIPDWEMDDDQHRAKVIPCEAYRTLRARGRATNVLGLLGQSDFVDAFVVEDRGVIAVGVVTPDRLFIGFRGTAFLYDWKINARSRLVPADERFRYGGGRLHSGFAEEALRIALKIDALLQEKELEDRRTFISGHSLGGAVAAIARNTPRLWESKVCIFGAPRYGDLAAYRVWRPDRTPLHVSRPGDMVPTLPPKRLGYIDHPQEVTPNGVPFFEVAPRDSRLRHARSWARFVSSKFHEHGMEAYRGEVGEAAGSKAAWRRLTDFGRLDRSP